MWLNKIIRKFFIIDITLFKIYIVKSKIMCIVCLYLYKCLYMYIDVDIYLYIFICIK